MLIYANGDSYEGGFKNDLPNGIGTLLRANGGEKKGVWKDGKLALGK